jgi:hypothetical protein
MSATMARQWGLVPLELCEHVPCIEYGQNGYRRVFACHNWGNTILHLETSHQSPWREDVVSCVSRESNGKCWDEYICCYVASKSNRRLPSLPTCGSKESADTVQWQSHKCTSTRTDSICDWNATCINLATQWQWGSSMFRNWRCATQTCVYKYSISQCSGFQSCCIPNELQALSQFYSRCPRRLRTINWLVHYLLRGIRADRNCADVSRLLSEPEGEDEHW